MNFLSRLNLTTQGLSLILVAALCLASTSLNHYTTLSSTDYFRNASSYEALRLADIHTTQLAQSEASKSSYVAAMQTQRLGVVETERDEAREVAIDFYQGVQELNQCLELQDRYIGVLTKTLIDAGITVPNLPVADESTVVPVPPSPPKADRPAQNFPGVEVHKSDFGS